MSKTLQNKKKTQKPAQKQQPNHIAKQAKPIAKQAKPIAKQAKPIAKQAKKVQKPAIAPNTLIVKEKVQKKPPKTAQMKKQAKGSQREEEKKGVDEARKLDESSSEENQVEELQAELKKQLKVSERQNEETVDHLRKIIALEEERDDLHNVLSELHGVNESLEGALDREKKEHDKQIKVTDVFARKFDAKMQEKLEEESALKRRHEVQKLDLETRLGKMRDEKEALKRNLDDMTT